MSDNPNSLIQQIFADFSVDGVAIPVAFLRYDGKKTTYVTYQLTDSSDPFDGDDELLNYVDFYDFDIYSQGNYLNIIEAVKTILKDNGFRWQPTRSSGDYYEDETKLFHRTLSFSIERSTNNG